MSLFSNYVPFKVELENYIGHCKTVFEQIGDAASASLVQGFMKDIEEQRYNITIVGSYNRGKSTILNTLMERHNDDISPISSDACTSAIIRYNDKAIAQSESDKEKAVVYFSEKDGSVQQPLTIPLQQLKNYVTEERNPENRKYVRSVDVFGDFPEWSKAVTIVDSPGQNSVFGHHDVLLRDFLPYTDAIIFLVSADIAFDGGDIALLKELSEDEKKKIFFVLTKVDKINNPDDLDEVKSFAMENIQKVGLSCDKLYAVSAKPVYDALTRGVSGTELDSLKRENGILELEEDLEKFIVAESDQTKVMRSRIEILLKKTSAACRKYVSDSEKILSVKTYDRAKLKAEKEELLAKNESLRENAKKALKKFSRDWDKAISQFQRKFATKSEPVADRISSSLQHGGLLGAVFQSFKLHNQVQKAVGLELQPIVLDLEIKLEEAINELNSELNEELSLYVKRKNGTDAGAVTASGVAMAAMAGTVTWGISATNGAIASAMSAFGAWQAAAAASTTAAAANSVASVGALAKLWGWLWGTGEATKIAAHAANAAANAANAASSALVAGMSAVVTAGVSIAAILVAQKILHIILVAWDQTRIVGITDKVMNEMEENLFKGLDAYKESLIKEYQQNIDDMLDDITERLAEIENLFANDDSEERKVITARLEEVKGLLSEGVHVQKQIPMLQ